MAEKKVAVEKKNSMLLTALLVLTSLMFFCLIALLLFFPNIKLQEESKKSEAEAVEAMLQKKEDGFLDLSNKDPEVGGIVEKVSKHMLLPKGEITVATVNDADRLREINPSMFQYVKEGDKLLVYPNGMIIYDPAVDKIVDVIRVPVSLDTLEGNLP